MQRRRPHQQAGPEAIGREVRRIRDPIDGRVRRLLAEPDPAAGQGQAGRAERYRSASDHDP